LVAAIAGWFNPYLSLCRVTVGALS
jgi:hypothetical protein